MTKPIIPSHPVAETHFKRIVSVPHITHPPPISPSLKTAIVASHKTVTGLLSHRGDVLRPIQDLSMWLGTTDLQKHRIFLNLPDPLEKKELEGFQYKYSFKELQ